MELRGGPVVSLISDVIERTSSPRQSKLCIRPMTFRQACAFVKDLHRHHKPPRGHKYSIGVEDEQGQLRGVAMVGRPVARTYDNGFIAEVNRTCTDGCPNANSALYGAAWRSAKGMGYRTLITYTQIGESGSSLRAAGFRLVRSIKARGSWADSTGDEALRAKRDPIGSGGVGRFLWAKGAPLPDEIREEDAA